MNYTRRKERTMKRYIDANLAQKIADTELDLEQAGVVQYVLSHTPTVDPEDFIPKSKWEHYTKKINEMNIPFVRCKRCRKERPFDYGLKYCHNCGARIGE